ncbi:MAG: YjbF family lipoprotein [Lentilitoribacter sp.]|uniref:YjbF family lipoprotein n=1 Tax=Tateyamaria sp. TaxID=1929288 RepID=UPI003271AA83
MTSICRACVLCLASTLFGCSGGSDAPYAQSRGAQTIVDQFRKPPPTPENVPEFGQKWIAALTTPTLEVTLERSGRVAVLAPFSDRPDSTRGAVRVWRSADDAQIVLRGGVLIATRGLGNDVDSTLVKTMVAALSARAPVSGRHVLYTITGENSTKAIDQICTSQLVGYEVIDIFERQIKSRHVRLACKWGGAVKSYDFWVDERQSTVWQSRQWAGPDIGYVRTRLLKE